MRRSTLLFHLTQRLLYTKWRDPGEEPKLHLFGQLKRITKQWLDTCLSARAAPIRRSSCTRNWPTWPASASPPASPAPWWANGPSRPCSIPTIPPAPPPTSTSTPPRRTAGRPTPAAATSTGSFSTATGKPSSAAWPKSHPQVRAYVKNHNLGFEVPYRYGSETRKYLPDFIVLVDDGHGDGRPAAPDRRDQRLPP